MLIFGAIYPRSGRLLYADGTRRAARFPIWSVYLHLPSCRVCPIEIFHMAPVGLRRRPVPFGAHSAFGNSGDQIWRFSHRACFSYHFYVCGSGDSLPSTLSFFLLSEGTKQTINQASSRSSSIPAPFPPPLGLRFVPKVISFNPRRGAILYPDYKLSTVSSSHIVQVPPTLFRLLQTAAPID